VVAVEERRPDEVARVAVADLVDHDHQRSGSHEAGRQEGQGPAPAEAYQHEAHRNAEQGSGQGPGREVQPGCNGYGEPDSDGSPIAHHGHAPTRIDEVYVRSVLFVASAAHTHQEQAGECGEQRDGKPDANEALRRPFEVQGQATLMAGGVDEPTVGEAVDQHGCRIDSGVIGGELPTLRETLTENEPEGGALSGDHQVAARPVPVEHCNVWKEF
ncbi:uncharacterized protein METZ01_LOCUS185565, partial [marine metagenome]